MKSLKSAIAACGLTALASLAPARSEAALVELSALESTLTTTPLYGAAITSEGKLGLGTATIFEYANDLSSSSELVTPVQVDDAGTWNDQYVLLSDGTGIIDLVDLSTGYTTATSTLNGYDISGISSAFEYNGSTYYAIMDSNDDTVKFFEWGSDTLVATGPYVGENYTGLEVLITGTITNLDDIPILVSRDAESGVMLDQYYHGTIVGSYTDTSEDLITDISYDSETGILTASHDMRGRLGKITNYDFAQYVIPEPNVGLLAGLGVLGAAAMYQNRKRKDA
ncbi:hypothetical protein H5P28_00645 [Ruficoccus amylovorans]|uniref:PEP-CTERM protein-sorting domain-containing protein n=1 Tax=Ruficoccus amylovorans TaxID=1804625 RepID=A0A842H9H4_9BACT|nr:hypothetical protein [Ruficoccus amylovorans]MBC2592758.1 hypothetical protein [Ruficoccus amylovorans]